jgi:hypothetical protein
MRPGDKELGFHSRARGGDAMLEGAAKALAEVLRARRPDLSWEVTVPDRRGPGRVADHRTDEGSA